MFNSASSPQEAANFNSRSILQILCSRGYPSTESTDAKDHYVHRWSHGMAIPPNPTFLGNSYIYVGYICDVQLLVSPLINV